MASIANLLEETSSQRRWWLSNQKPSVETVLEKFPCLTDPTIVDYVCVIFLMHKFWMMKEFCNLKSIDKEGIRKRWCETVSKLFKYAIIEEKKSVKTLLRQ